jgi:hypothetical protein
MVPPSGGAGVAADAVELDEELEAAEGVAVEGGHLAAEELVEGAGGHEAALERADRLADVLHGDGLGVAGEGGLEGLDVAGDRLEGAQDVGGVGHGHLDRVDDRHLGLVLDGGGAAVPELGEVGGGVVDGGAVALAALALVTLGGELVVDAELVEEVAGVAGDVLALRQARVVVELATEGDLLGGGRVGGRLGAGGQRA